MNENQTKPSELQRQSEPVSGVEEVDFILQQLELGFLFADLAHYSQNAGQNEDSRRQKAIAQQVYQAVMKFVSQTDQLPEAKARIKHEIANLEARVTSLGASF